MNKVKVYQFECWDNDNGNMRLSRRWATREAIERTRIGVILEATETEVSESRLDGNGMLKLDESPKVRSGGFQSSMELP